ncbi:hypothetical protein CAEBREN_06010 [Caenorhabditis brenneri]|uniref:Uncharacterized protein n=1 Tax=Caenorhabditis brenneri TaxID=135651 RepID=G0P6L2_CAEBE|nr:hypothetical protein CAEBREN_06010 [Caenorhabditis brenneri]
MSSKENARELSMNPQKKRLEQLKKRREYAEMVEKQQMAANSKSKKKASREPVKASRENVEQETDVKMSAENVDYEYSVEEDYEDDEYKSTKNETIKKLLMHKFKLEKSLKLSRENEKKLNAMLENSGKWFDKYEKTLEELEDQVTIYDQKRKIVVDNLIENVGFLVLRMGLGR